MIKNLKGQIETLTAEDFRELTAFIEEERTRRANAKRQRLIDNLHKAWHELEEWGVEVYYYDDCLSWDCLEFD